MFKKIIDVVVVIGVLFISIPVILFWCMIGLGHGIVSIINGTD